MEYGLTLITLCFLIRIKYFGGSYSNAVHFSPKHVWLVDIKSLLRIDNSGRSVIYTFDHNSQTMLVTIVCDIPN